MSRLALPPTCCLADRFLTSCLDFRCSGESLWWSLWWLAWSQHYSRVTPPASPPSSLLSSSKSHGAVSSWSVTSRLTMLLPPARAVTRPGVQPWSQPSTSSWSRDEPTQPATKLVYCTQLLTGWDGKLLGLLSDPKTPSSPPSTLTKMLLSFLYSCRLVMTRHSLHSHDLSPGLSLTVLCSSYRG